MASGELDVDGALREFEFLLRATLAASEGAGARHRARGAGARAELQWRDTARRRPPASSARSTRTGRRRGRPRTAVHDGTAAPYGVRGLAIAPGERLVLAASRDAFVTDALVRREPGELFALRHGPPRGGAQAAPVETWVERLHPETLEVLGSSVRLPGGPYWPGGIAADRSGELLVVFGAWAHRLSPSLEVLASHHLPGARPHNSFVLLSGGELVTKDCDAPAGLEPSTVSILDPVTRSSPSARRSRCPSRRSRGSRATARA